jgi:flagellar motor protein MotB
VPAKAVSKKIRLPRIERDEEIKIHEDENATLWAVSYADFLMAVLSFFILFYSSDTSKRKAFIMNLSKEFSNTNHFDGAKADKEQRMPANMFAGIKNKDISVEAQDEVLILNFSDNFFGSGNFSLTKEKEKEIADMLEKLKPYENQSNIFFEGHADDRPVRTRKGNLVSDNFVLSSLRASSALKVAKKIGFSDQHLFLRADSSNIRNSRSLSIRIEPKEMSF